MRSGMLTRLKRAVPNGPVAGTPQETLQTKMTAVTAHRIVQQMMMAQKMMTAPMAAALTHRRPPQMKMTQRMETALMTVMMTAVTA